MAQTSYTPIQLYYSTTAAAVPLNTNLASGELAINITDGLLFYKDNGGTVQKIGYKLTPTTAGGTGLTSFTANGVVYASSTSALATGSALTFNGTSFGVGSSDYGNAGTINVSVGVPATTVGGLQLWSTTSATHYVNFGDGTTGSDTYRGYVGYVHASDALIFGAATAEGMRLTSTSLYTASTINVGIGTSSPGAQLQLNKTGTGDYTTFRLSNSGASGKTYEIGVGGNTAAAGYANNLYFYDSTAATLRMVLDTSGNLGIGTSSPTTAGGKLTVQATGTYTVSAWNATAVAANVGSTYYMHGGVDANNLGFIGAYFTGSTTTGGGYLTLGTRDVAGSTSEKVRIDASGNLGVGSTSISAVGSYRILDLNNTSGGYVSLSAAGTRVGAVYGASTAVGLEAIGATNIIQFIANGAERARITSGGYFKATNDGTYIGASSAYHEFRNTANASALILSATNASLSDDLFAIYASRNTTNNSFFAISYFNSGAAAYKFRVADSGNVTNTNNSYGQISDIKLKENIVDATPKLEKLSQVRVVNFNFIGDQQKQLGVIAQELEQVFPSMVEEMPDKDEEGNDLGTTTKSVKYSVFVPMLIKAIQEQQALITTLTARITALESA